MAELAGELQLVYLVHFRVVHEAGRLVGVTGVVVVVVGVVRTGAGDAGLAAARRVRDWQASSAEAHRQLSHRRHWRRELVAALSHHQLLRSATSLAPVYNIVTNNFIWRYFLASLSHPLAPIPSFPFPSLLFFFSPLFLLLGNGS